MAQHHRSIATRHLAARQVSFPCFHASWDFPALLACAPRVLAAAAAAAARPGCRRRRITAIYLQAPPSLPCPFFHRAPVHLAFARRARPCPPPDPILRTLYRVGCPRSR